MKSPILFLGLVLAVAGTTNAATRSPESASRASLPVIEVSTLKGSKKAPIVETVPVVLEAPEHYDSKNIHKRRPSADQGFRYSSNDWLVNLLTTPLSYTLRRVRSHLIVNTAICFLALHLQKKGAQVKIPMTGHSLLGSSLGLLLGYRTNSAYARFWEARGLWTKAKVLTRNLTLLMKYHISAHSPRSSAKFLKLLTAYPGALMFLCLGGTAKLSEHTQKYLPYLPVEYAEEANLPCILLIVELQKALHAAKEESRTSGKDFVEASHLHAACHMVEELMGVMASCEKILRTPVPWTYTRHTSRFLTIWLGTLPFTLIGDMKPWLMVAIVIASSYCMIGIEEIGHLIEQPFLGDPLDGDEKIESIVDEEDASPMLKRGRLTQPYDIGIPVCSMASHMRKEIVALIEAKGGH